MLLKIKIVYVEMFRPTRLNRNAFLLWAPPFTQVYSTWVRHLSYSPKSPVCRSEMTYCLLKLAAYYHTLIPSKVSLNNELMFYQHLPHLQMLSQKQWQSLRKMCTKRTASFWRDTSEQTIP